MQLIILISVIGLAVYQVLSVNEKRKTNDDVFLVKNPEPAAQKSVDSFVKTKKTDSGTFNKSSVGFSSRGGSSLLPKPQTEPKANQLTDRSRELLILKTSWEFYFEEWQKLAVNNASMSDSFSVEPQSICIANIVAGLNLLTINFAEFERSFYEKSKFFALKSGEKLELFEVKKSDPVLVSATKQLSSFCEENKLLAAHVLSR